jgi:hypothetical protein
MAGTPKQSRIVADTDAFLFEELNTFCFVENTVLPGTGHRRSPGL